MANWCSNIVQWKASVQILEQLETLFLHMAEKAQDTGKGQLPDGFDDGEGYFFDLNWECGTLYYETRWSPNTGIVKKIADVYGAGFIHSYQEMGNGIYGEAEYIDGELIDVFLEHAEFSQYEYDDDAEIYHFEGQEHDSDCEILETLLERKLRNFYAEAKPIGKAVKQITDMYGECIVVEDLQGALEQAEMFRDFKYVNPNARQKQFEDRQQKYWSDIYQKLLQLQSELNNPT